MIINMRSACMLLLALALLISGCGAMQNVPPAGHEAVEAGPATKSADSTDTGKQMEPNKVPVSAANQAEETGANSQTEPPVQPADDSQEVSSPSAKEEQAAQDPEPGKVAEPAVTVSIRGEGEIGTVLESQSVAVKDGDTVLDVLKKVTKANKISMEYRGGSGAFAYVEGIGNIYEFDHGPASGWTYSVNGEEPKKSAGVVSVKDGDRVEWLYVLKDKADKDESE